MFFSLQSPPSHNPRVPSLPAFCNCTQSVRRNARTGSSHTRWPCFDSLLLQHLSRSTNRRTMSFSSFREDPAAVELGAQLGVARPLPSLPINRVGIAFPLLFFLVGVAFDRIWASRRWKANGAGTDVRRLGMSGWPQVPSSFSMLMEKDLQRKESAEWVNMVIRKVWMVYRSEIEEWVVGSLQPMMDNVRKPDYAHRIEIDRFSLGDEPLSVRSIQRITSRRVNDLQYQIGIRYTGGAHMLLSLSLKFGIIPMVVSVGIHDFDIDGELWVKLRLIPSEPWVGDVSWAFVTLPKIKLQLSPLRLCNFMAIPVLSVFLTKLLTEDLPCLFVRPKKIVLDFQNENALGHVSFGFKNNIFQEKNKDFVGELSVTLVDARKLAYIIFAKTDPYVILRLGDQVLQSKRNSQTTITGPPGEPIWNQDFHLLVANPQKQRLYIQVKDTFGLMDFTIGTGEIELGLLQDTVPADKIIALQGSWGLFRKQVSGEILFRLTYKAYVEDEVDDEVDRLLVNAEASHGEMDNIISPNIPQEIEFGFSDEQRESFIDGLSILILSETFHGIIACGAGNPNFFKSAKNSASSSSKLNGSSSDFSLHEPEIESITLRPRDLTMVWLAAIASIAVLICINMGGSSLFMP